MSKKYLHTRAVTEIPRGFYKTVLRVPGAISETNENICFGQF